MMVLRKRLAVLLFISSAGWAGCTSVAGADVRAAGEVRLENDLVTYIISAAGKNMSFRSRAAGKEYCAQPGQRPFMKLKKAGVEYPATACVQSGDRITVQFGKASVTVALEVAAKRHYFVFEVESVTGGGADELLLTNLAVKANKYVSGMSGVASDGQFAVFLRALNLQVQGSVGGRPTVLASRCYRRYGLVGAKVAVGGCPAGQLRDVLKELVRGEGLPYSPLGGPWALDAQANRGSYVFASVSESNVDDWIALARKAGLAEVHFIGWQRSLGHYEPRKALFPHGLEGLKATVAKLHAAGLKAGLHTLTGCISPHDRWVTPVPDRRLAADATFTLAADLDQKQTTVLTDRAPGQFDTVWAYGAHGNVLRIDDELIQYTGLSQQSPYGFTGCRRGAFGTRPAAHAKGAGVDHLFVRYGCFLPDEDSTLVDDVAGVIANIINTCQFDMVYMDGAEGMPGGWHGVARMRRAIFERIRRPVLVEASSWGYQSWPFHSRIGAWDYPNWGLKRFIDVHCRANEQYRRSTLLPAQLGWWALFGPSRNRYAELPDEVEYLCVKSLGYDMPMSFQAVSPGPSPQNARQDEYLAMIGRYERLRLANYFPEAVKGRLREPGQEFHLISSDDGGWQFVPTDYAEHTVTGLSDGSQRWQVENRFAAQPVKLRIQALDVAEPYEGASGVVLADWGEADQFARRAAAAGVTCGLERSTSEVKAGGVSGRFWAKNSGTSRRGAWARLGKLFPNECNIEPCDAIGLWIHGDGKGELINVQLVSPRQYYHAIDEHYVRVDFTGWRYVELLLRERDAGRFEDYRWPYRALYAIYRAPLVRGHVTELNLYYNELPPGESVSCLFSPIKALRTQKVTVRAPSIGIGGRRIVLPVEVRSGGYVEFEPPKDCRLYDERGALIKQVKPAGQVPLLAPGRNAVEFSCRPAPAGRARVKVTVISRGQPFGPAASPRR